jgi:hypothetical protein
MFSLQIGLNFVHFKPARQFLRRTHPRTGPPAPPARGGGARLAGSLPASVRGHSRSFHPTDLRPVGATDGVWARMFARRRRLRSTPASSGKHLQGGHQCRRPRPQPARPRARRGRRIASLGTDANGIGRKSIASGTRAGEPLSVQHHQRTGRDSIAGESYAPANAALSRITIRQPVLNSFDSVGKRCVISTGPAARIA